MDRRLLPEQLDRTNRRIRSQGRLTRPDQHDYSSPPVITLYREPPRKESALCMCTACNQVTPVRLAVRGWAGSPAPFKAPDWFCSACVAEQHITREV